MGEKVTTLMVLKVDLDCSKCYMKVKKTLSKFPQIRDQVYDEKQNTVTIKVVCCSPEIIRDKLCCKAGGSIKSIEIKAPGKPKEPEKKKEAEKSEEPEKKKETYHEKPKEPEKKKEPADHQKPKEPEKNKASEKPKKPETKKKKEPVRTRYIFVDPPPKPKPETEVPQPKLTEAQPGYPPTPFYPFGMCCPESYGGHGGPPPRYCYDGYYGRPCYSYFSEENPSACTIM
ncbi:pollen-specific leucine-rich repeat extensin-like protein 1 isoform X1 [Melia azedarach]|uniref:Pollen-specific leucine-rich repeat extensin-like protein 1 isoform X1 n=1 Tax=Melia azedarach TaxID=155640 RepID=A0ACC1X532_MELAZ|nr:pollen-specific leucine-rich repeat extensin-like protein 1 isoform X1 [Melia azedarach]